MTPKEIIEKIGAPKIAAEASVTENAVSHWKARGIPSRHWPLIVDLAADSGVEGVTFAVLRNPPMRMAA